MELDRTESQEISASTARIQSCFFFQLHGRTGVTPSHLDGLQQIVWLKKLDLFLVFKTLVGIV